MKKKKKVSRKLEDMALIFLVPVAVLILWQVLSAQGRINASILPAPERVWDALVRQVEKGSLALHIVSSLSRVVKGYLVGAAAGLVLGVIAALSRRVGRLIEIPVGVLRPIPAIAMIPFFILWMGIGEKSKIAVIVFGTFWPVLLNTMQGICDTDDKLLEVGTVLEKKKWIVLTKIILPSALPSIFTGLRLGIGSAWTCVVAAEMIAASSGIGFLISYSREMAQPANLLIGIATIGLLGLLIDAVFKWLNNRLLYWRKSDQRQ